MNNPRKLIAIICLCISVVSFAEEDLHWHEPEFFSSLVKNHPDYYRRVYYYYDHKACIEYNRIQFMGNRSKIKTEDITRAQNFYEHLYMQTFSAIKEGKDNTISQYATVDSISYTIKGSLSGSFDLGSTLIDIDLGNKEQATSTIKNPDFRKLEAIICKITAGQNVQAKEVKYTGFKRGIIFVFQRGKGKGWTSGIRYTINNASLEDFERVRDAICSFIGSKAPVTVFDRTWQTMVKSETTPSFYAVGYDPSTKTINILKATVESEICIPFDWQKIDYLTD